MSYPVNIFEGLYWAREAERGKYEGLGACPQGIHRLDARLTPGIHKAGDGPVGIVENTVNKEEWIWTADMKKSSHMRH